MELETAIKYFEKFLISKGNPADEEAWQVIKSNLPTSNNSEKTPCSVVICKNNDKGCTKGLSPKTCKIQLGVYFTGRCAVINTHKRKETENNNRHAQRV